MAENSRLKVLISELAKSPGEVLTLALVRRAINMTVMRLPALDTDPEVQAQYDALQRFEELANDKAGWVPDWEFSKRDIDTLLDKAVRIPGRG